MYDVFPTIDFIHEFLIEMKTYVVALMICFACVMVSLSKL
jgi:hypothetical protein